MFTREHIPLIGREAKLAKVISEITRKSFGCVCVVDDDDRLAGIITDGDLWRLMQKANNMTNVRALYIMNKQPKVVQAGSLAMQALQRMEQNNILQLVVVDAEKIPVGMVHLFKAGINSR